MPTATTTVGDYAYLKTDGSGNSYWALASGNQVYDAGCRARSSPEADLSHRFWPRRRRTRQTAGSTFTAADRIGFMPRASTASRSSSTNSTNDGSTPLDALTDLMDGAMSIPLNLRGSCGSPCRGRWRPISPTSPTIRPPTDLVHQLTTSQQQLVADVRGDFRRRAPSDAAGATDVALSDWLPIINIVLLVTFARVAQRSPATGQKCHLRLSVRQHGACL